jgi:hypothetical protein
MIYAHGVYSYFDERVIMQTWYRNLCFIYFSLCTEFYILNCKSNVKLVTGKIMCLQLRRRVLQYKWWNRRFNFFVKTYNVLLCTEVLEIHFVLVYRIARVFRIMWVLVRISTPKSDLYRIFSWLRRRILFQCLVYVIHVCNQAALQLTCLATFWSIP